MVFPGTEAFTTCSGFAPTVGSLGQDELALSVPTGFHDREATITPTRPPVFPPTFRVTATRSGRFVPTSESRSPAPASVSVTGQEVSAVGFAWISTASGRVVGRCGNWLEDGRREKARGSGRALPPRAYAVNWPLRSSPDGLSTRPVFLVALLIIGRLAHPQLSHLAIEVGAVQTE